MTPDDEPTPTDETSAEEVTSEETALDENTSPAVATDADHAIAAGDAGDARDADDEGVEAEATLLEKSQATIDDAHDAVEKVAATDAIGEDATGAGDLPAFADSTEGVEKPDPDDA